MSNDVRSLMKSRYRIEIVAPDGSVSRGEIEMEFGEVIVRGRIRRDDLPGEQYALGRFFGRHLALCFGERDKVELGFYSRDISGALKGRWIPPTAQLADDERVFGRETLVPNAAGNYDITDCLSISGEVYTGEVRVAYQGDASRDASDAIDPRVATMAWHCPDGVFTAFALHYPAAAFAVFNFAPETLCGLQVIEIDRLVGVAITNQNLDSRRVRFIQ